MKLEKLKSMLSKYPLNSNDKKGGDGKYHYVYLIVFVDGHYYIGKHSTFNCSDGYFASGILPNKLREEGVAFDRIILSYEESSASALFLESDILSNGLIYSNEDCLNCYPGSPPSLEGFKVIRKGSKFKMINPKLLDYYLGIGWEIGAPKRIRVTNLIEDRYILESELDEFEKLGYFIGRISLRSRTFVELEGNMRFISNAEVNEYIKKGWTVTHPHRGTKVLRKNNELIKIDSAMVSDYVDNGYEPASTVDGLIYIRKNGKFKRVHPSEITEYIENGWNLGTNLVNTIYVNNGIREYRIAPDDLKKYEANGCKKGRLKWVWLNNGISEIRLNPNAIDEISKHIESGYSYGKKTRTTKRKVIKNGEIRYIVDGKLESYLVRGWELLH